MNSSITIGLGGLILGVLIGIVVAPTFLGPTGSNMMGPASMMGVSDGIDQHFIDQMIPHHEGAIEMAELALEKSARPEILSLAQGIIDAQTREINDMTAWYQEWFNAAPSAAGHSMMRMEGMEGDLDELLAAADFDKEFLSQMIVHHEMAVMMAQMLAAGTERPEMEQLAENIITSQTQEIEMMRGWLSSW
ncbi:hypothetical protein A3F55_02815 [Candidatus Adlerbacteria bacterium RIFCSPHIGHO2_12_FULL_53_18]|uniref:DUF305 domain-containing protein n=1 Tax=Candidatus Adlerbacteria bacterium RIFCSPHIGHO2_12_FULL_53_18 TaxID=1797242 RepID=A0A1F4XTR6_9BACT|nr:MAG: hypothetical protein A3F55_02815 [Candidatus Adlerbacteria bacterium RIFCSPHIGHO2_12_FULL_53_18]